jgi:hypothetical protein
MALDFYMNTPYTIYVIRMTTNNTNTMNTQTNSTTTVNTQTKLWKAKEGREVFIFKAENRAKAEIACEMWNAVLIGEVKNK